MGGGHAIHQMGEGKKADMRIKVIGQIMPVMVRLIKKKYYVEAWHQRLGRERNSQALRRKQTLMP